MSAHYQETNGHNGMSIKQRNGNHSKPMSIDDYMLQEQEWEREAVLDPAWERQQKKVGEKCFFKDFALLSIERIDL